MRPLLLSFVLSATCATAQVVDYQWLNLPCSTMLNCDTGCSACNMPQNSNGQFFGNDVGWLGVNVCPHPVEIGDNTLLTYGWPAIPDDQHAVIITGIAFTPTRIDSVIIRHRAGTDGPQRMQVRFGINESMPQTIIADLAVPDDYASVTIQHPGDVVHPETMVYGFFSLLLQPYQGDGGSWDLDDIRIVGSPMEATGILDLHLPTAQGPLPRYDALGRPMVQKRGLRFYIDRSKRVIVE